MLALQNSAYIVILPVFSTSYKNPLWEFSSNISRPQGRGNFKTWEYWQEILEVRRPILKEARLSVINPSAAVSKKTKTRLGVAAFWLPLLRNRADATYTSLLANLCVSKMATFPLPFQGWQVNAKSPFCKSCSKPRTEKIRWDAYQ